MEQRKPLSELGAQLTTRGLLLVVVALPVLGLLQFGRIFETRCSFGGVGWVTLVALLYRQLPHRSWVAVAVLRWAVTSLVYWPGRRAQVRVPLAAVLARLPANRERCGSVGVGCLLLSGVPAVWLVLLGTVLLVKPVGTVAAVYRYGLTRESPAYPVPL